MPTPSSNTPPTPPDLPPRTHSSSCPEDVHSPSSWRPDEDGLEMNVDSDATTSPEAMSAPTADMVELLTESRSTTESPRPESQSGTDSSASEPIDVDSPTHKPPEELGEVQGGAIVAAPVERHRSQCDLDTSTAEHDKLDDDDARIHINHGEYQPSMGFDYSTVRVCAHECISETQLKTDRTWRLSLIVASRYFLCRHLPSYGRGANSMGPSSPNARYTMSRSKLSMSICASHSCVVISRFKASFQRHTPHSRA